MTGLTPFQADGRNLFDRIRHIREDGSEFWSARELGSIMGYANWQNMREMIERAKAACSNAQSDVDSAFTQVTQLTEANNLGPQRREDYELTRYAAYLAAMNGDPRKPEVAKAQQYFAIRTREAEVAPPVKSIEAMSRREILLLALEAEDRAEAAEGRVAALEPAAQAWETLAAADGDYSVREAAQVLSRAGAEIGQQRLFSFLVQIGWADRSRQPYQRLIGQGLLGRRLSTFTDPVTTKSYTTSQLRVTVKGVDRLRAILSTGGDA